MSMVVQPLLVELIEELEEARRCRERAGELWCGDMEERPDLDSLGRIIGMAIGCVEHAVEDGLAAVEEVA